MAGTVAFTEVALTKTVVSDVLFQRTTAPGANALPVAVRVKAGPPALVVLGVRVPSAGPATIVKFTAFEVIPPDDTVIRTVPTLLIKLASTGAVTWFELITLVASAVWFQFTTASVPNPVPFTVNVNAGPPAVAALGLMLVIAGAGATVKPTAFEVTPPDSTVI